MLCTRADSGALMHRQWKSDSWDMVSSDRVSTIVFLQDDIYGGEVVEITVGIIGCQFCIGAINIYRHDRHDVLENLLQPQRREGIGVDDGNLWSSRRGIMHSGSQTG